LPSDAPSFGCFQPSVRQDYHLSPCPVFRIPLSYYIPPPLPRFGPEDLIQTSGAKIGVTVWAPVDYYTMMWIWGRLYQIYSDPILVLSAYPGYGGGSPYIKNDPPVLDKRKGDECNPNVIKNIAKAWSMSGNGDPKNRLEPGFTLQRVPGHLDDPGITYFNTNQRGRATGLTLPAATYALFHVHPNSLQKDAPPSPGDVQLANEEDIAIYTISQYGLFMYSKGMDKPVQLTSGPVGNTYQFLKPCGN
jgi:hypothetical protein